MMAQNAPIDQDFVSALQSPPTGIYYRDVARFDNAKVIREFRIAVRQPDVLANEDFMSNVLFLIRKREIHELHDDVAALVATRVLKARPYVSALKTMVALGSADEQKVVDRRYSELLEAAIADPSTEHDVVPWAERLGGAQTLVVLIKALHAITAQQRAAEAETPPDFSRISQFDRLRSSLENQSDDLKQKLDAEGLAGSERAELLADYYMRRVGYLAVWSYKELVDHPSAASAAGVRQFLSGSVQKLVPKGAEAEERAQYLYNLRLRGLCLLQKMGQATAEEDALAERNKERIAENPVFYTPAYDWEDVLDTL